ncbi:Com family DNA-binding transcriptional regulator [Agitococcus lubricus]|uniref:Com family DNA-binding transcriptional regulator n=1 Tax=Agitococcus lubricus TaxID=1077255 RepID=UPI000D316608
MTDLKRVIKCSECKRKLAEADKFNYLSLKCPRCKTINILRTESSPPECHEHLAEQKHGTDGEQTRLQPTG